jgi:enoyl-CoA hydratase/carnithine racemase
MPAADAHVEFEVSGGIATITLDRPERLNAFTKQMELDLVRAFDDVDRDDAIRAAVVTGRGRAFCAGVDLGSPGVAFQPDGQGRGGVVVVRIHRCRKPVIGAVNGAAVGVGASLLLPMDIRLAATSARFGFVFARRGLIPDGASAWFLPRIVDMGTAAEWFYSGRTFGADEALRTGLVREVVADDQLLERARELAGDVTKDSSALAMAKRLLWHFQEVPDPGTAYEIEARASDWLGRQPDAAEGIRAFLEKRTADFPMRVSRDLPPFGPFQAEH